MTKCLLIVYVKKPIPGLVKTRLIPSVGAEKACEIYTDLLNKTLAVASNFPEDLLFSYDLECPELSITHRAYNTSKQIVGTLGDRMVHDFDTAFKKGYQSVLLIGSDIPSISLSILKEAQSRLSKHSMVIGPTYDGGYYLIGIKKETPNWKKVFHNISWSTSIVLKETLQKGKEQGVSVGLIQKLHDIDVKEDLEFLDGID